MDYTACDGKDCPKKQECYRYMGIRSRHQTYFVHPPVDENTGMCEYFLEIDGRSVQKEKNHE